MIVMLSCERMKIKRKLLIWYKKNGRDLPWRKTRDPYKILVSEVMLQQTQVPRVLLYYKKWLKRFPNWSALARATNADVIREWAGLGYNRRALALRDIAKNFRYRLLKPVSSQDWQTFKGIGPYTAAALAVFTRTERVMPIDTNIRRVLGRLLLGNPWPDPKLDEKLQARAEPMIRGKNFDLIPQALFDLATSICKKVPDCALCPLRNDCPAAKTFLSGTMKTPNALIKKSNENIHRNKKFPDRIYRGRILRLVQESSRALRVSQIGSMIDTTFDSSLDQPWLEAMIGRLEADQFIKRQGRTIRLY